MKMSSPGLCCDGCFEVIGKKDTRAARLWLDFCTLHLHSKIFGLLMKDEPSIQLLENLGLITTTETDKMLIVKVHHFHMEGHDSYFCGGLCD